MFVRVPKIKKLIDLGVLLFVLKTGFDVSGILPHNVLFDNIFIIVGLSSMIFTILQQGYSVKVLFVYALVTVLSLCSTIISGQSVIVITVVTILAIRGLDFSITIRKVRIWSTWFLCIHTFYFIILYLLGKVQLFMVDGAGRVRAAFGFGHANSFSIYIFNIILMWVWEKYDDLSLKDILKIALLGIILFELTDSKTSFLCMLVLLVLLTFVLYRKLPIGWINTTAKWIFPGLSVFYLFSYRLFLKGNMIIQLLDKMLTGRIMLGAYALEKCNLSFIGQKMNFGSVAWTPEWKLNYFTLDCTYTSMWVNIGWIWIIVLSVCFYMLGKRKEIKTSVFIIMWSLYAITEVHGMDAYLCFPILMVSTLLNDRYKGSVK